MDEIYQEYLATWKNCWNEVSAAVCNIDVVELKVSRCSRGSGCTCSADTMSCAIRLKKWCSHLVEIESKILQLDAGLVPLLSGDDAIVRTYVYQVAGRVNRTVEDAIKNTARFTPAIKRFVEARRVQS